MAEEPVAEATFLDSAAESSSFEDDRARKHHELRAKIQVLEKNLRTIFDAFSQSGSSASRLRVRILISLFFTFLLSSTLRF
jgi:hypothetical protein